MRDVDSAKVSAAHVSIDDLTIGENMGKGTFRPKLAVSLAPRSENSPALSIPDKAYFGEVLARRPLSDGFVGVEEGTGLARLACALAVEFARYMRGAYVCQYTLSPRETRYALLLVFGGLRGPKPISRMFAPCAWPFPMRPPDTGMGPFPFAPAMLGRACGWGKAASERRWFRRGPLFGLTGEKGGLEFGLWAKGSCCECGGCEEYGGGICVSKWGSSTRCSAGGCASMVGEGGEIPNTR